MFNTPEILGKIVKDFIFGTGKKPTLNKFNEALAEINKDHADGASVNKAHYQWIQYYNDMEASLPFYKRFLFRMLDCPVSSRDDLLGFTAFAVENDIHFDDTFLAKVDKRSELNKSLKLIVALEEIKGNKIRLKVSQAEEGKANA